MEQLKALQEQVEYLTKLIKELVKPDIYDYIDENTLSVNVNRLRKKLKEIGLDDFIMTKKGLGYKLVC